VPTLLVPGLNCTARLYANLIPHPWQRGPVMVADHIRSDTVKRFALILIPTLEQAWNVREDWIRALCWMKSIRHAGQSAEAE